MMATKPKIVLTVSDDAKRAFAERQANKERAARTQSKWDALLRDARQAVARLRNEQAAPAAPQTMADVMRTADTMRRLEQRGELAPGSADRYLRQHAGMAAAAADTLRAFEGATVSRRPRRHGR